MQCTAFNLLIHYNKQQMVGLERVAIEMRKSIPPPPPLRMKVDTYLLLLAGFLNINEGSELSGKGKEERGAGKSTCYELANYGMPLMSPK